MKKKIIIGCIAIVVIFTFVFVMNKMNMSDVKDETVINNSKDVNEDKSVDNDSKEQPDILVDLTSIDDVNKNIDSDLKEAKSGIYKNMDFSKCVKDIPKLNKLCEIYRKPNYFERKLSLKDRLKEIDKVIDIFYDGNFKNKDKMIYSTNFNDGRDLRISFTDVKSGKYEGEYNEKYMIFFRDEREHGGKGFCQIDPGLRQCWMSRGELEDTAPMTSYSVSKIYNVYDKNPELEDTIKMKNGDMKVKDGIAFVEDYFNNKLFDRINKKAPFRVSTVEILDTNGFKSMGFRVAKSYNDIKFETAASIQVVDAGEEENADSAGEVVMARNDQIDNFSGLGAAHDNIEEYKEYKEIVSLKDAIKLISESIGENSKYEIREVSVRYQSVYTKKEKDPEFDSWESKARPMWKISGINKEDETGMNFYVNMGTGEVKYSRAQTLIAVD